MSLLEDLNSRQKEAVMHQDGPLLLLAGAGSGKTRALTYRVAYLIQEQGISPYRILAVTFTNKAAREMKERIQELIQVESSGLWVSTFHSMAARILRRYAERLDYDNNYTILDPRDQKQLVKGAVEKANLDPKRFPPRSLLNRINRLKNELLSPEDYALEANGFYEKRVLRVYSYYQQELKEQNAMDFGDLLLMLVRLLEENRDLLLSYQDRFQHLLVDEYQDVNHAQYRLVKLLAGKRQNICVVGDPDQGIYSFRGASIKNILDFEQDFPHCRVIRLEENYRSTACILQAAQGVICQNKHRHEKDLWTRKKEGDPIHFYRAEDGRDEARFVAEEILSLQDVGWKLSDMALFYRVNAQSRSFEEVFSSYGIPYTIVGGIRFYERRAVKDIIAYLRAIYNPADEISLLRVINRPRRGIGKKSCEYLLNHSLSRGQTLFQTLAEADQVDGISSSRAEKIKGFHHLLLSMQELSRELSSYRLTCRLLEESGYLPQLEADDNPEARDQLDNVMEFLEMVKERGSHQQLPDLLQELSLLTDIDAHDEELERAVMMTLHSAKGLEYPIVFLTGMEEGNLPHFRSLDEEGERGVEEERRLCYVGMTRAEERLYLTSSRYRTLYGQGSRQIDSRFLQELPFELLLKRGEEVETEVEAEGDLELPFGVGDSVMHQDFGPGRVIGIKNDMITVDFEEKGRRDLIFEYAPLELREE